MSLLTDFRDTKLKPGVHTLLPMRDEMSFSILIVEKGSFVFDASGLESALVLIQGEATIQLDSGQFEQNRAFVAGQHAQALYASRKHWKNENPFVLHLNPQAKVTIESAGSCRFGLVQTVNAKTFLSRVYMPEDVTTEHRGRGVLNDASYRLVRTVFDAQNAPPEAKLVLGEVMNFPGCWSSYPPHHHAQNEFYYYEFDPVEGFGFAQCGDDASILKHQDLLFIDGGKDHAQVAAPGYSMYYIWAIRHGQELYKGFEYTAPYDRVLTGV